MKMRSVVFKLFIITSVLILVVFSMLMLAEGLFFDRFYRFSKIQAVKDNMNQFSEQFKQAYSDEQQVSRLLGSFMNLNDASTSILNGRFERLNINPYYIQLRSETKTITVRIPTNGITMEDIPLGVQNGDGLVVDGIFMDENDRIMHPVVIARSEQEYLEPGLVRVTGTITDIMLPEQRSYNPFYQDVLMDDALRNWIPTVAQHQTRLQNGLPVQIEWKDEWSGIQYAVLIQPLAKVSHEDRYLFTMTSLQPVGEAVEVLQRYFIFMTPIIVMLAIILSFFYSRMVSRPLVILNRSVASLAKLDFTEQQTIVSKDEFGELSRNMIQLSRNLDATLKELTQANLKLREEMAEKERSEKLRKELVANISHELKTPLGIIKGFAEGLQDEVASDKKDRYLSLIVNETDQMNALIMDMLELSKFEVKAVKLHFECLPFNDLIHKVLDSFAEQLERKQLRIRIDNGQEGEELFVIGDFRRIEQVVLNLLSNAVRHAAWDSVISIRIHRNSNEEIITTIENTGTPIAEEDLSRIWDQFYRVERSRDRKSGGTGLGLSIVKHILELHESEFGVINTDQGVAFYFILRESRGEKF